MKQEVDLEGFYIFWATYPRRVGKLAAIKAYKRALKVSTAAEILRGAKLYAKDQAGKDQQFTAHPTTWLNAGRWGDYPAETQSVGAACGFYAAFTSAELDAWNAYGRRTKGLNYPADKRGGWYFPTQWPPGYQTERAA